MMDSVRIKILACKVLFRELSLIAAASKHFIDITYLRQSFHDQPEVLRSQLQSEIDRIDAAEDPYSYHQYFDEDFDAVVLAYGLCSNATMGLRSRRYRLVLPRAHDCITLLLGSRDRYREYFDKHPGTYWYTCGWNESVPMPGERRYNWNRRDYAEKYGEDNADYLMTMEQDWMRKYDRAVFVRWPEIDSESAIGQTRDAASFLGWQFDELSGNSELLRALAEADWDDRFLVLEPGDKAEPSYDSRIIRSTSEETR
ncbi:MAG TPA: DUF1638 domain-containing protein [Spirochaetia bacterium]|nr:DUF1638 domain-containing protein [Spirochaetia bacterium]